MWKYKCILYFLFKCLSSGPNTIYQKFRLFSSYVKYRFNHRTNVLVHMLIIYIFAILFHFFPVYSYAELSCVNCKVSLDILISNRVINLLFFSPWF